VKTPDDIHRWLTDQGVSFRSRKHSPRFTAQEVAQASAITGHEMAKVILVKADDRFIMAVVPATKRLSVPLLAGLLHAREVRLATEDEFAPLFPGCDRGAMPPLGNLYGLEMMVDRSLSAHPEIAFNACNHTETVTMSWADYEKVARPVLVDITEPETHPA
jgi:Ala-tRNA(Pro) deacylase